MQDNIDINWWFSNFILVLSNFGFLLPAIACIKAKKYIAGFFFICTCTASSIYHVCKWGSQDFSGYGGYCISGLSFEMTYAMDYFFSQIIIPISVCFFINPKCSLVNIEERYSKWLKQYHTHDYDTYAQNDFLKPALPFNHYYELQFLQPSTSSSSSSSSTTTTLPIIWCKLCGKRIQIPQSIVVDSDDSGDYTAEDDSKIHLYSSKKIALFSGFYYCNINTTSKITLEHFENFYILFHVFVIALGIKLVGPSFYFLTLPLIIYNIVIILILVLISYLSEIRMYLKRKLCRRYLKCNSTTSSITLDAQDKEVFKRNYQLGRKIWRLFNRKRPDLIVHIVKWLPKRTLLHVDVLKSLEWSLGTHKLYKRSKIKVDYQQPLPSSSTCDISNDPRCYKRYWAITSVILAMIALSLFTTQHLQPPNIYSWTHSAWHILGPLGLYIMFDLVL